MTKKDWKEPVTLVPIKWNPDATPIQAGKSAFEPYTAGAPLDELSPLRAQLAQVTEEKKMTDYTPILDMTLEEVVAELAALRAQLAQEKGEKENAQAHARYVVDCQGATLVENATLENKLTKVQEQVQGATHYNAELHQELMVERKRTSALEEQLSQVTRERDGWANAALLATTRLEKALEPRKPLRELLGWDPISEEEQKRNLNYNLSHFLHRILPSK